MRLDLHLRDRPGAIVSISFRGNRDGTGLQVSGYVSRCCRCRDSILRLRRSRAWLRPRCGRAAAQRRGPSEEGRLIISTLVPTLMVAFALVRTARFRRNLVRLGVYFISEPPLMLSVLPRRKWDGLFPTFDEEGR